MRQIRLGYNAVPAEAEKQIIEVFRSGQYSPGKKVHEFEEKFAKAHQAKHAIFVNSGTDALRLSLLAMKESYGWDDGDLVAVTTQTFVATVNVILQAGLKPFFYDNGNPWNLEHKMRTASEKIKQIKCVMPVHLFGEPCDPYIFELAKKNKWKVLEDSCETILNEPKGDISCHSTYMAHHLVTGVGGFALTNDWDMHIIIRSFANHGRSPYYIPGFQEGRNKKFLLKERFTFDRVGYSCRGTEFEAVMGLSQLDGIEDQIKKRRSIAKKLSVVLMPYWGKFQFCDPDMYPGHTFMMYPIVAKDTGWKFDKYKFCEHLEKNGIETRDMMPITNQRCYKGLLDENDFPVSKWINQNGFYVSCHSGMDDRDVGHIAKAFKSYGLTKT